MKKVPVMRPIPFQDGDRVVVIGERLLESDQTVSSDSAWVRRLGDLLIAANPDKHVEIIDRCSSGASLHLIRQRWDDDVGGFDPQWVLVILGLSDSWQHIRKASDHMDESAFEEALTGLVEHHKKRFPKCNIVLIDQPFLNPDRDPAWNTGQIWQRLPGYHRAMSVVAERHGLYHVTAQTAFDERLAAEGAQCFGGDDQHPDQEGSVLLAHSVLKALGMSLPTEPAVLKSGQRVVFIGDSITDAGRRDARLRPFGSGYVRAWHALLRSRAPSLSRELTFINRGIGGNTIRNLKYRWQVDCLDHQPDHLVVKIGINDMNRWLSHGEDAVSVEEFETIYDELLGKVRAQNPACGITLLSPFYLSRDTNPMSYRNRVLEAMPSYYSALERVGHKHDAEVVNLQALFLMHLTRRPHSAFSGNSGTDIVHPSETGCMVIAEALYGAMR